MRLGLGVLRLPPQTFWSMTPRELAHALGVLSAGGGEQMTRGLFAALQQQFPD